MRDGDGRSGLTGTYYPATDFTGTSVSRVDSTINFDFTGVSPVPRFLLRITASAGRGRCSRPTPARTRSRSRSTEESGSGSRRPPGQLLGAPRIHQEVSGNRIAFGGDQARHQDGVPPDDRPRGRASSVDGPLYRVRIIPAANLYSVSNAARRSVPMSPETPVPSVGPLPTCATRPKRAVVFRIRAHRRDGERRNGVPRR